MTVYRKDPGSIRNWYDALVAGIGHRKSSFCDLDVIDLAPILIAHDRVSSRALVVELKHEGERMKGGQEEVMRWLSTLQWFTSWQVIRRLDDRIGWYDFHWSESTEHVALTPGDFRAKYHKWWNERVTLFEHKPPAAVDMTPIGPLTAEDIFKKW